MKVSESSPYQIPTATTFAAPEPSEEIPASPLPEQPLSVEQAKEAAETIKTECGEQITVNKVFDGDLANVLFTIGEEEDVDINAVDIVTAPAVDALEGSEDEEKEVLVSI